jgi:acyl dehydratase
VNKADLVGRSLPTYSFPVEAGKVMEFANAVLADDPVHTDPQAAAAEGFPGVVAPPTFSAAAQHWAPPASGTLLDLDLRRVLAAGAEWDYHQPIVAGDVLTVSGEVVSVEHKEGRRGGMTLITRENRFVNQRGELAMAVRSTVIELDDVPAHRRHEEGLQ